MARTQAADYEQRREAIVGKAARLFAAAGFRGTSVADLAAACDTSKSLIYHYFPSKEDILYAVMASHLDQLVEAVAVVAGHEAPDARLRVLVHGFVDRYVGAADRQKVLLNELDSLPPDKRAAIVATQRAIIGTVAGLLAATDPALALDPVRARAKAMLLFGMINWTHTWFNPAGPISIHELADMALGMALPDQADARRPTAALRPAPQRQAS